MADFEKAYNAYKNCSDPKFDCNKCIYLNNCKQLDADILELLKSQKAEIERLTLSGEWKRMSDLPIETDDRFECSICGNVVHYHDRINLYTFNDYCGRCGAYNGFKLRTVSRTNDNKA